MKINEEIGMATQNAANLINALTLMGSNFNKDDPDLQVTEISLLFFFFNHS